MDEATAGVVEDRDDGGADIGRWLGEDHTLPVGLTCSDVMMGKLRLAYQEEPDEASPSPPKRVRRRVYTWPPTSITLMRMASGQERRVA